MSTDTKILRVFIASPGDLAEERALLDEVVAEFNLVWGDKNGVRLELIKWETHTYPGFGADAQDVINTQIGESYDIFIGMMWGRFGTSTARAESGTEEEFHRAFARFERAPEAVQLMFYFKDAPLTPSEIDLEQLAKVMQFKQKISAHGGLYHKFSGADEFQKVARIHLSKLVQDRLASPLASAQVLEKAAPPIVRSSPLANLLSIAEEDEDEGILDLSESISDLMSRATEIADHVTGNLRDLSEKTHGHTKELKDLNKGNLPPSNRHQKRIADNAAKDIDLYVQRMAVDIPEFDATYSKAMDQLGRMIMLSDEDLVDPTHEISKVGELLSSTQEIVQATTSQFEGLRDAMAATPRMTTAFNRSKKRGVAVTNDFIALLKSTASQVGEVMIVIQGILERRRGREKGI